ncbi:MAG: hypothetical protein KGI67_10945 [Pseudomonadota bacterium]|nr:hypothetical protein [Pseudomonadota bacterium]
MVVQPPLRPDRAPGTGQRYAGKSGWLLAPAGARAGDGLEPEVIGGTIMP